ncbi:MAG: two component transcriptional regulator [Hyphomonadaceae bacterium]|nr:MAG: two component transcriptional regulator [Hyphomonadaceae bacterium]KAF0187144.1 MAG: two component transcriptional regulator [Hyphomonadaceae bacterium]
MFQKHKIIIANFDTDSSGALVDWLNDAGGFEAVAVDLSADDLVAQISEINPDLIIIDSDSDNFASVSNLEFGETPLITIGRYKPNNENFAANHFSKPIRLGQLETKIRFLLRAREALQMSLINIEGFELNPVRKSLTNNNGVELKLTDKEVAILTYLNGAAGSPVTREELLREVWRYNKGVTTHTLETHIYKLRQKLSTIIGQKEVLLTQEGGYQLAQ